MTYKKIKELNYKALDLHPDLKSFLQKNKEVKDIMDAIEYDIEVNPNDKQELINFMKQNQEFFCNMLFNWMTEYEFMEYCKKRFPEIPWGYEVIERYWVR